MAAASLAAALLTPWAIACGGDEGPAAPPAEATQEGATAAPVPELPDGPAAGAEIPPVPVSITLWTVEALEADEQGGLAGSAALWLGESPAFALRISQRPSRGENGVLPLLLAMSRTAPAALPDVVALPLESVAEARESGIIAPLPARIGGWPFTDAAVIVDGGAWAAPLALAVPHLVQARAQSVDTETTSTRTWDSLLESGTVALPNASGPGALAVALSLYVDQGGDAAALPVIDRDAASRWLSEIADANAAGRLRFSNDPLDALRDGTASAAIVSAGSFLHADPESTEFSWAAIPGREGPMPVVATGWGLALIDRPRDEDATERAIGLIAALTAPEATRWVLDIGMLPASRGGLLAVLDPTRGDTTEAYLDFLTRSLESARGPAGLARLGSVWAAANATAVDGTSLTTTIDLLDSAR